MFTQAHLKILFFFLMMVATGIQQIFAATYLLLRASALASPLTDPYLDPFHPTANDSAHGFLHWHAGISYQLNVNLHNIVDIKFA